MEYTGVKSLEEKQYCALSFDCINYVMYHPLLKLQHNIDASLISFYSNVKELIKPTPAGNVLDPHIRWNNSTLITSLLAATVTQLKTAC